MEKEVSSALRQLSSRRRTNRDELALQQVLEDYFWDDNDFEEDPPNGTTHKLMNTFLQNYSMFVYLSTTTEDECEISFELDDEVLEDLASLKK